MLILIPQTAISSNRQKEVTKANGVFLFALYAKTTPCSMSLSPSVHYAQLLCLPISVSIHIKVFIQFELIWLVSFF